MPIGSLNPYSTGSNSNLLWRPQVQRYQGVLILILLEITQIIPREGSSVHPWGVLILILLEVTQIMSILPRRKGIKVLILILLEVTQILWLSIIYFLLFVLYISHKVLLFNTIRYIPITFSQMYVLFLRKSIICLANIGLSA